MFALDDVIYYCIDVASLPFIYLESANYFVLTDGLKVFKGTCKVDGGSEGIYSDLFLLHDWVKHVVVKRHVEIHSCPRVFGLVW